MSRYLGWVVLLLTPGMTTAEEKLVPRVLDELCKDTLSRWGAPGVAVAVVRGEETYVQGFGRRAIHRPDPVTPETVFALASMTKAFTAASLGLLVDAGKLRWDDRVRTQLDWFRLQDPLADRDVTIRDLLCHRIGLGRHDLLWYRSNESIEQIVRRMAHLEPAYSFRSRYEYNNLAYLAAGLVVEKASGRPWHEFVRQRLLEPLGMTNTVFTDVEAREKRDYAVPHRRDREGNLQTIAWYPDAKQIRAAGSLKAGVRDLVPWMRLHLNRGKHAGTQLISERSLGETHRAQIVLPVSNVDGKMTESTYSSYGLGWRLFDYRGVSLIEHGGANDGFRSRILLVPGRKLGITMLTNCEDTAMVSALSYRLLDALLGLPAKDWHAHYHKGATEKGKPRVTRKTGTKPSLAARSYAGSYHDPAYGELRIEEKDGELTATWSSFRLRLSHYHYDTFEAKAIEKGSERLEGELATFALDSEANVASVQFFGRTFASRLRR